MNAFRIYIGDGGKLACQLLLNNSVYQMKMDDYLESLGVGIHPIADMENS
jgi:hypothetical protein